MLTFEESRLVFVSDVGYIIELSQRQSYNVKSTHYILSLS